MKLLSNFKEYFARKRFDRKYRIVEMANVFIPQAYESYWQGIDRGQNPRSVYINHLWLSDEAQIKECGWKTYEQANERLLEYLDYKESKIPKIHKVTVEPKMWRILKRK